MRNSFPKGVTAWARSSCGSHARPGVVGRYASGQRRRMPPCAPSGDGGVVAWGHFSERGREGGDCAGPRAAIGRLRPTTSGRVVKGRSLRGWVDCGWRRSGLPDRSRSSGGPLLPPPRTPRCGARGDAGFSGARDRFRRVGDARTRASSQSSTVFLGMKSLGPLPGASAGTGAFTGEPSPCAHTRSWISRGDFPGASGSPLPGL